MLLSFSLENWMSFKNEVSFSMIASRERQHRERVPKLTKYRNKVLPVSVLYGGNASGKSNFFNALSFARDLVVEGTNPDGLIPVNPFLLRDNSEELPTKFSFLILAEETIYEFSFEMNKEAIIMEKLVELTKTSGKLLYHRKGSKIKLNNSFQKKQFLNFVAEGTRANQLFLTNSISQSVEHFRPIYDWFKYGLVLISPNAHYYRVEDFFSEGKLLDSANEVLPHIDIGISRLGGEDIPFTSLPFPDEVRKNIGDQVLKSKSPLRINMQDDRIFVSHKNGELISKRLVTYHTKEDGAEEKFELHQESDGTKRIIDLIPAFFDILHPNSRHVVVIDEIDRSLHTLLVRYLLENYLNRSTQESRSQLLMTTHDVQIMDQNIFRRDEMWLAEKDFSGISSLFSLNDFEGVRSDKDIQKSYLQGRFGGVPKVLMEGV